MLDQKTTKIDQKCTLTDKNVRDIIKLSFRSVAPPSRMFAMPSSFIPAERQRLIRELVRSQGVVKVVDLSDRLDVSEITIRRDLETLEQEGILERTHGGAIYSQRKHFESLFTDKGHVHRQEKKAIGQAAAAMMEDGDTLLINSGSSTLQVIRHLRLSGQQGIKIITNNVGALTEVQDSELELILTGGTFRQASNSLVGPLAARTLEQVNGHKAVIGVAGISARYGLTTPVLQEANIVRLMIERTRGPVIVVADYSKVGVVADFVSTAADKVDILVTDRGFEEEYRAELEEQGIEIVIASTSGPYSE
jgi:DeoR family fructose operon transcriptional repressor